MDLVDWAVVVVALAGAFFNVRRKWYGFIFWLVSNAWWMVYYARLRQWPQAVTFAIFWLLSAWGIYSWRRAARELEATLIHARKDSYKLNNKQVSILLYENAVIRKALESLSNKRLKIPVRRGIKVKGTKK